MHTDLHRSSTARELMGNAARSANTPFVLPAYLNHEGTGSAVPRRSCKRSLVRSANASQYDTDDTEVVPPSFLKVGGIGSIRPGFTLLEMIMVLGIMVVLMGAAIPVMQDRNADNKLTIASEQLAEIALEARYLADREGRPYEIFFSGKSMYMLPYHNYDMELYLEQAEAGEVMDTIVVHEFPDVLQCAVRYWDDEEWLVLDEEVTARLVIPPTGLSHAIQVQFQVDDRKLEVTLSPLTNEITRQRLSRL